MFAPSISGREGRPPDGEGTATPPKEEGTIADDGTAAGWAFTAMAPRDSGDGSQARTLSPSGDAPQRGDAPVVVTSLKETMEEGDVMRPEPGVDTDNTPGMGWRVGTGDLGTTPMVALSTTEGSGASLTVAPVSFTDLRGTSALTKARKSERRSRKQR